MAYGKPKIAATDIKKEILQEVSDALDRNSDFGSENLSFYGYSCQFELNLILQARGPEAAVNVIGSKSRAQTLEPGETPVLSRRDFVEQWLTDMEAGGKEVDAESLLDFIDRVPTDEPDPEAKPVKVKGRKSRGETKAAKAV